MSSDSTHSAPAPQSVRTTSYPTIKNAVLPAEGNGSFSNLTLAALIFGVPLFVKKTFPLFNWGGMYMYFFLLAVLGVPVTLAYWTLMSMYGPRKNEKCTLPGKAIETYLTIRDPDLRKMYAGSQKIPMQVFHDAYFDKKIDFKGESLALGLFRYQWLGLLGDVLDMMEYRHDWAKFTMTPKLFEYVITQLIPDVIFHTREQDENQIRDNYDRA